MPGVTQRRSGAQRTTTATTSSESAVSDPLTIAQIASTPATTPTPARNFVAGPTPPSWLISSAADPKPQVTAPISMIATAAQRLLDPISQTFHDSCAADGMRALLHTSSGRGVVWIA